MNPETLDRLLMDRALGGLSPDVEALLDSWLARNPDAAARARDYDSAAGAARQVLAINRDAMLPPLRIEQVRRLERTTRQLRIVRNIASLAAVLVIGVAIGAWQSRPPAARTAPTNDTPTPRLISSWLPDRATASADKGTGFWSTESLTRPARSPRSHDGPRVIWNSPIAKPTIGGAS